MESAAENRRQAKRYELDLPVRVGNREGHTRDVSSRGLYIMAPSRLEVGATIELDLALPSASPGGPLSIRVLATIIRVDDHMNRRGLAAQIESWEVPQDDLDRSRA